MPADSKTGSDNSSEPPSKGSLGPLSKRSRYQAAWPWILCLVGLDYLSTLGYMPSIAFDVAGRLAPLAMLVLAAVTLLGALPVYFYLAGRSPNGQGSVALLERLIPGWLGKLLILVLLGFAATDLIFTRTFSAADAAEHALHCPQGHWQQVIDQLGSHWEQRRQHAPALLAELSAHWSSRQLVVTLLMLAVGLVVAVIFRDGFRKRFVQVAAATTISFALLNLVIVGFGIAFLCQHPERVQNWWAQIQAGDWQARGVTSSGSASRSEIWEAALGLFPKVALGLSGFEMAMLLMPMVRGRRDDDPDKPRGRIRNTRKLLVAAAVIVCFFLVASSLVCTLLIPPDALRIEGQAQNRALSYLAHGSQLAEAPGEIIAPFAGVAFGTLYDISTIAILCLAGVSVTICLTDFVPPYLHRLGMEFEWLHRIGALIYVFTAIKLIITFYYNASVDEQRGAYTTAVLVIFTASAFTVCLDIWRRRAHRPTLLRFPLWFGLILTIFIFSATQLIVTQPGGAALAVWFILFVLATSIFTRFYRSTELRFKGFEFIDKQSQLAYEELKTTDFPILVPHRAGRLSVADKEAEIRARHRLGPEVPLVFVTAELGDSSDFFHRPRIEIRKEDGRVIIDVRHAASLSHVIAAIAIDMSRVGVAPEVHFGWSDENPITANLHFVLFGHGNVPWLVYTLLRQSDLPESQRPRVVVG